VGSVHELAVDLVRYDEQVVLFSQSQTKSMSSAVQHAAGRFCGVLMMSIRVFGVTSDASSSVHAKAALLAQRQRPSATAPMKLTWDAYAGVAGSGR